MIKITDPADCSGCSACYAVCPHEAIEMCPDALGFLYPKVNPERCTDCGLCERVCAFNDSYDTTLNFSKPIAYAARHKDLSQIASSRSGAVFVALSDYVLEQGGVVYGAGYADHFRVVHKRATNRNERDEFRGSKYVQSDMGRVFRQVKQDLKAGLTVLFSGTPCQTAGLNSYIGPKLRENLYLVDIVCHGTPGPAIWEAYLQMLEKKQGSPICYVNFRDKSLFGWAAHHESFKFVKGGSMTFTDIFYQHIMFRHSCGKCHYANTNRPSDITLADFWGWEKTDSDFNADDRGVSLVLVNTEKGRILFNAAKEDLNIIPAKLENCMQPNLQRPSDVHPYRMEFERAFASRGLDYAMDRYCRPRKPSAINRIMEKVKHLIKKSK